MAGLCGILSARSPTGSPPDHALAAMAHAMDARGPGGRVIRVADGIALAALVDGAAQGGIATSGEWTVAIAGVLQNARALRAELAARDVRCETEAAIAAHVVSEVGAERALGRFEGALAFVAWDAASRRLWIARDASGVHALYTVPFSGGTAFATDLAALSRIAPAAVTRETVQQYLVLGQLPTPRSWLPNARALAAGTLLRIDDAGTMELRWYEAGINPRGRSGNRERWAKSLGYAVDLAVRRACEGACSALITDDDPGAVVGGSLQPHVVRLSNVSVTVSDLDDLLGAWPVSEPIADGAFVTHWGAARATWASGNAALILPLGGESVVGTAEAVAIVDRLRERWVKRTSAARPASLRRGAAVSGEESLAVWSEIDALEAACPDADASAISAWFHRRLWLPERAYRAAELATSAHGIELRLPFADAALTRIATQIPSALLPRLLATPTRPLSGRVAPVELPAVIQQWARSSLTLRGLSARLDGWIDADHVEALVRGHADRGADYTARLWALSTLGAWRAVTPGAG